MCTVYISLFFWDISLDGEVVVVVIVVSGLLDVTVHSVDVWALSELCLVSTPGVCLGGEEGGRKGRIEKGKEKDSWKVRKLCICMFGYVLYVCMHI